LHELALTCVLYVCILLLPAELRVSCHFMRFGLLRCCEALREEGKKTDRERRSQN
jgi:hypothetical protein